jgi:hypothetical protein
MRFLTVSANERVPLRPPISLGHEISGGTLRNIAAQCGADITPDDDGEMADEQPDEKDGVDRSDPAAKRDEEGVRGRDEQKRDLGREIPVER